MFPGAKPGLTTTIFNLRGAHPVQTSEPIDIMKKGSISHHWSQVLTQS